MRPFVFICADSADRSAMMTVIAELEALGVHYRTADGSDHDVQASIDMCTALVPIVSRRSAQASWLSRHVSRARLLAKPIYPLKVGNCTLDGMLGLMQYEWLYGKPSERWFLRLKALCSPNALRPHMIFRKHQQGIWAMAYDQSGKHFLATGGWDRLVKIWTKNIGEDDHDHAHLMARLNDRVLALAYSPGGSELAIGCEDRKIYIWSPDEYKVVDRLEGHAGPVRSLAYTSDGDTLFSASTDSTALVWQRRPREGRAVHSVKHDKNILSVACGPHDATFATASEDTTVCVWNNPPTTKKPVLRLQHDATAWGVAFSPDGEHLASVSKDRTTRIWDARTGKEVSRLQGHKGSVIAVAYSADGRLLATGSSDETAQIWEVSTEKLLATYVGHSDAVRAVAFSPDRRWLTTASADGTAIDWPLPPDVDPGER